MFYIPEKIEEIKSTFDRIMKENEKNGQVSKVQFIYALTLLEAYHTKKALAPKIPILEKS